MAKRITSFGHGEGDAVRSLWRWRAGDRHGYGYIDGYGAGKGCIDGYGYGAGDGRGHGDGYEHGHGNGSGRGYMGGYGYGHKGGDGNGYWYGAEYGCIDGHGYRYMDGYEYGCGYEYGYGEISPTQFIGAVGGYPIDLVILFGLVRVGCEILSLNEWKKQWREIAENNNVSISEAEVRLILEKCKI